MHRIHSVAARAVSGWARASAIPVVRPGLEAALILGCALLTLRLVGLG
jgi:hypothetical protein